MASLVTALDDRWDRTVAGLAHDIHHTSAYHRYAAETEGSEPWLILLGDADRGLAWPYLLRPVADVPGLAGSDARDIGSLHGCTGPLTWGLRPGDAWLRSAWEEVTDIWSSQGAVSAFVRFHPLLGNRELATGFTDAYGVEAIEEAGLTVSVDCTASDDLAVAGYALVTRQEIGRARRAGLATEHDEGWQSLDAFLELYAATRRRQAAVGMSDLSAEDVVRLRRHLGDDLHLLIVRQGRAVVAAGVFSERCGIVQALLVGVDEASRRHAPQKVLIDDARRWAHARGDRVLYLGGGRGGRADSLLELKSRFSNRRHTLYTGRWVLDPARYEALSAARRRHLRASGVFGTVPGWFPAYRAPAAAIEAPLPGSPPPTVVPVSAASRA